MIKFAIIGCGRISDKHIKAIQTIGGQIIAVCDINLDKAIKIGKELNCDFFEDYLDMLSHIDVDIVDICTPSGMHPEMAINALKAGFNVISEKPMALDTKKAKRMIEAAKKAKKRLFIVKQNRFNPPIIKLKEAIEKDRFGKLYTATVTVRWARPQDYYDMDKWRGTKKLDGNVLHNQASHHIDLLLWLIGPVASVFAYSDKHHDIEVDDTIHAVVKFINGAIGTIEATTCAFNKNMEGSITVIGEKGAVKVGGFAVNKMDHWDFKDWTIDDENITKCSTNPPDVYGFGHIEFMRMVKEAIEEDKDYIDGEEGIKSLELTEAIELSLKTGEEVFLRHTGEVTRSALNNFKKRTK